MAAPFLLDAGGDPGTDPRAFATGAADLEAAGFDGIFAAETKHDPFVSLTAAAMRTERVTLMTGIAVAFARSPMTVAETANDLQLVSQGRFVLGLGSQIRTHVERRFSMPWSAPASRMREYVAALRAIWGAWASGERLRFEGEHYRHTLMTPFFSPGENPFGPPPVWIAAVGAGMTETAGAVASGTELAAGGIRMDLARHRCELAGKELVLTVTEFELLRALVAAPGRVFERGQLIAQLHGGSHHITERTVDSHIRRLRKKLAAAGADPIETVYGLGYRLREGRDA